jgi:hypothetical protein
MSNYVAYLKVIIQKFVYFLVKTWKGRHTPLSEFYIKVKLKV